MHAESIFVCDLCLDARAFELFAGYCGLALHYSQVGRI